MNKKIRREKSMGAFKDGISKVSEMTDSTSLGTDLP